MGRAPCCEKVGLKKGRWTEEEDEILTNYIHTHGEGSWRSLPKNAGLRRCGKSCRLRWINYLRSDLKRGNISLEEEEIIIKLHATMGNRWSMIAHQLPGRTDNEIKNYWNSHLSKKINNFRQQPNCNQPLPPATMDLTNTGVAPKRRGGRTSRSAMKKNKSCFPYKGPNIPQDIEFTSNELVPMPLTPALDSEANTSNKIVAVASPYQNHVVGMPGSREEREGLVMCPWEERESDHGSVSILNYQRIEINGGMTLSFHDIVGDETVLDPKGAMNFSEEEEEREKCEVAMNNAVIINGEQIDSGAMKYSSNGDQSTTGEILQSCCSTKSCNDWDLDWDAVVEGQELWGNEEEKLLSWL